MPKPPLWFTLVSAVAVLWNIAGLLAVVSDLRLSLGDVSHLSPAQQALYAARPLWSVASSILAVVSGTVGSVGLAIRRRWSITALIVSLLGVIGQDVSLLLMSPLASSVNRTAVVMQSMVVVVALALIGLAKRADQRQWLS